MKIYLNVLLLLALLASSASAWTAELRYAAAIDVAEWRLVVASRLECRLEHPIPRFGRAIFTREAGRELRMHLETGHRFGSGISVELRSESTAWKASAEREVLGWFETNGKPSLFKISRQQAERVMLELHDGFQPGFLFYDDVPLIASLSTVGFRDAQVAFADCIAGLHDTNFRDVRLSHIHFEPDYEFASMDDEEGVFERVLEYLQVDDSISEILVTGHTDHSGPGCYNDGLSERRAWYVYDLLLARGIDDKLLRVDYVGEERPAVKGAGKQSKAENRRVTVELRRTSTTL